MLLVPSLSIAAGFMERAARANPGPWVAHSVHTGKAAHAMASHCPGMDADAAYILAYLHDIGRQVGVTSMRHAIDGYNFLSEQGYHDAARICITHSFPYQDIRAISGKWDCSADEFDFVQRYLNQVQFDAYDRLVQLCDALALPTGICLLEKRMVDVVLRHGVNEYVIPKWHSTFGIKADFERQMGYSIYSVLPGVVETTFGCVSLP